MVRLSAHLLYYDAVLTMQSLVASGNFELFFSKLFEALDVTGAVVPTENNEFFDEEPIDLKICDKRALAIGLSHLLLVPFHELPPYLQGRMGSWVQVLVSLLEDVTRASAGGDVRSRDCRDSGPFADSLGGLDGWDTDGQDGWGDQWHGSDSQSIEESIDDWDDISNDRVTRWDKRRLQRNNLKHSDKGEEDEDDSDQEGMIPDFDELTAPLESIDELSFFNSAYKYFSDCQPAISQQLLDGLTPDTASTLQFLIAQGRLPANQRLPALEEAVRDDSDMGEGGGGVEDNDVVEG